MRDIHKVIIDKERCIKCGLCIADCPYGAINMTEGGANLLSDECIKCGHCVSICPKNCVSMTGFDEDPMEITKDMRVNPDEFLNQMKARRSIRKFKNEKIAKEDIEKLIKAGQHAPTATNRQGVSYVIIQEELDMFEKLTIDTFNYIKNNTNILPDKYKKLEVGPGFFFKSAPLVIAIKSADVVDATIAATTVETMAQSMGLGVFYSGMFAGMANNSPEIAKNLELLEGEKVVTALVIGKPDVVYKRTAQKETPTVLFK